MSTVDTTPQDPRVHIDWGGEHVTMQISTGNVDRTPAPKGLK